MSEAILTDAAAAYRACVEVERRRNLYTGVFRDLLAVDPSDEVSRWRSWITAYLPEWQEEPSAKRT